MENNKLYKKLDEIKNLIVNHTSTDTWLDINQAKQYCSCSISTIRRNIDRGSLKASSKLGKLLFKKSDLDNWLNN